MNRDELVAWLDEYLDTSGFAAADASLNGLQVEGSSKVTKVALAVDAAMNTFEQAATKGADMLIVHHGLFWGRPEAITGMHRARVKFLLDHDINLYASHLPLDAHREVGNNWGLARELEMQELQPFGLHRGLAIGVKGEFAEPKSLRALAEEIEAKLGEQVLVHAGGPDPVASLGIVSGGAAWDLVAAAEEGLDAFLTGEPRHEVFYHAFERGINGMFGGHYMTETVGVNLLGRQLKERFGLEVEFILLPTGL
ncbi:MAG TPA: Nif3-like dinuclear metal center hexameric protein [Trueperaceae bacterium]|nr:Nif3-like dinuclear metal center hexameric protein [Trueperaceae bacterium]HRQ10696.1 Nif3-like dinuclear metal center hexameric protein [Trueperaceae bacterium]